MNYYEKSCFLPFVIRFSARVFVLIQSFLVLVKDVILILVIIQIFVVLLLNNIIYEMY